MFESSENFLSALNELPVANDEYRIKAEKRQNILTKPNGALGRLEEIAVWLCGWQGTEQPRADRVGAFLFAGNHGVVAEGVSPFPSAVTAQMVQNFKNGGAAINALSDLFGHELKVIPIELDNPTKNFVEEPAMSEEETLAALNVGALAVSECDADIIYFGEMGIGNTTSAAAVATATFGGKGVHWAGPGTGLTSAGVVHKAEVIDRAMKLHQSSFHNCFDIMRAVGGRELAAIMGAVVVARQRSIPVLLDGFVVTAAVAPLLKFGNVSLDHCIAAHCSAEPGHRRLLDRLWLEPLLNLNMRLGEGTGAALAVELVKAAVATHNNMATFEDAQIAGAEQ